MDEKTVYASYINTFEQKKETSSSEEGHGLRAVHNVIKLFCP